jgi:hypothetical protein
MSELQKEFPLFFISRSLSYFTIRSSDLFVDENFPLKVS